MGHLIRAVLVFLGLVVGLAILSMPVARPRPPDPINRCRRNLKALAGALEMDALDRSLPPGELGPLDAARLATLERQRILSSAEPTYPHPYLGFVVVLPSRERGESGDLFCLRHGLLRPPETEDGGTLAPREQLVARGLTDPDLLARARPASVPRPDEWDPRQPPPTPVGSLEPGR